MESDRDGLSRPVVFVIIPVYNAASTLERCLDSLISQRADEELLALAYHERIAALLQEGAKHFREDTVNLVVSHLLLLGGRVSDSERNLQSAATRQQP